jgi:hypothetical protein
MKKLFLKIAANEVAQRLLKEETPEFWKKVQKVGFIVVAVAGVVVSLPSAGLAVPAALLTASQYAIAIGATLGISAQATKK